MSSKNQRRVIILSLFLLSFLVRLPNVDRPLSKHHEFLTAISLRVLQIWDSNSPSDYYYSPAMNYAGKANKFINNNASTTGKMMDNKGNFYYVSHPPFAYILPHFAFSVFNIKPTVASIQYFLIICSLISGWLVFLIAKALSKNYPAENKNKIPMIALIIYLFSSSVLWFLSNTYMSDTLVHCFFVLSIYFVLKNRLWLLGIALFLTIYTSWLGIFLVFFIVLYALIKKERQFILPAVIATIASLSLIFFQYSSIAGSDVFIEQMTQRFSERGSVSAKENSWVTTKAKELFLLIVNYGILYLPSILLIIICWFKLKKKKVVFHRMNTKFVFVALFPILLLHISLLNYSGHNFTSLYASLFLSVVSAILIVQVFPNYTKTIVGLFLLFSIGSYYFINRPGKYSWKGDLYAKSKNLGEEIKKNSKQDETIFLVTELLNPMVVVYAERNMISIQSEELVQQYADSLNIQKYVVFEEH